MTPEGPQGAPEFTDSPLLVPETRPAIGHFTGDGDYDVIDVFEGGMAEVFLCAPRFGLRMAYAFKSPKPEYLLDPAVQRAFRRECSVAVHFAAIAGILPVYGIFEHEGRPFLKMQGVLPGEQNIVSLRDVIERGPVSPAVAGYYLSHLTWALSMADERLPGVVHGDLKPENILMLLGVPNISDFGLATVQRLADHEFLLAGGEYMCPEATPGVTPSPAWDIYSLGVILAELLTGRRPGPQAITGGLSDPVGIKLLAISDLCRAADPAVRPSMQDLHQKFADTAPDGDLWPHPESATPAYLLPNIMLLGAQSMDWNGMVSSLLRNQDYEGVIREVERRPSQHRTWRDYLHRGTALSLLGRDEEALVSFAEAEAVIGSAEPGQLDRIRLEQAASLKRLGRYDEASPILDRLVLHGSDEQVKTNARLNLGALLVECGQYDRARMVLHQALASAVGPETPAVRYAAYINLAAAERRSNPEAAVMALRQAVALKPADNAARGNLAEILLFELDRPEEAGAVLDGMIGAGSADWEVLRRRLMCAVLTGDDGAAGRTLALMRVRDGQDEASGMLLDAYMNAAVHCRRLGKPDLKLEQNIPADLREKVASYAKYWPDDPPEHEDPEAAPAGAEGPSARGARQDDMQHVGDAGNSAIIEWDDPDLSPHIRHDRALGFDLYVPFGQPDAVTRIAAAYRTVASMISGQTGFPITGSPVLLVRCGVCGSDIATTTSAGDVLDCRCGAASEVTPVTDARLVAMREQLITLLYPDGEEPLEHWAAIVLVQLPGPLPLPAARWLDQLIEQHGLERLDDGHPARMYLATMNPAWELFLGGPPPLAVRWYYPPEARGSSHVTPVPVQAFLTEFRSMFDGDLNSMSFSYDTAAQDFERFILDGRLDEAEAWLSSRPVEREHAECWNLLASFAADRQDASAMERYVLAAISADPDNVEAWHHYAALLLRNDRPEEAVGAAERACELGPALGESWVLLADCRHRNGDKEGAGEAFRRAIALGADPGALPAILSDGPDAFGAIGQILQAAILGDAGAKQQIDQFAAAAEDWGESGPSLASALRRLMAGEPEDTVLEDLSGPSEMIITMILTEIRPRRNRTGGQADPADEAESLEQFGVLRLNQGKTEEACDLLLQALALRESAGDPQQRALTANNLAIALKQAGHLDEARDLLQQCLSYHTNAKDRRREANCLKNLGDVHRAKDQLQRAAELHGQALEIYRELDDQASAAGALISLGVDRRMLEDYPGAREAYSQALAINAASGNQEEYGRGLYNFARLEWQTKSWESAADKSDQAAYIFRKLEDRRMEISALLLSLASYTMLNSRRRSKRVYRRLKELGVPDSDIYAQSASN